MPTSRLTISGDIGGLTFNSTLTRSADGQISHDVSLPAATAGTVSSYTAGPPEQWTLNLPGHALALNDIVDVYWDAGRRYGMKVVGITGDDVTVEDGPAAGSGRPARLFGVCQRFQADAVNCATAFQQCAVHRVPIRTAQEQSHTIRASRREPAASKIACSL